MRLLIFLPAILIPACASSSPAFLMMYSAYKLNKLGDNIQPWHTPFPIWNWSVVPCPVLTVASWLGWDLIQYNYFPYKKRKLVHRGRHYVNAAMGWHKPRLDWCSCSQGNVKKCQQQPKTRKRQGRARCRVSEGTGPANSLTSVFSLHNRDNKFLFLFISHSLYCIETLLW